MKPSDIAKRPLHLFHKRHRTPFYLYIIFYSTTHNYVDLGFDMRVNYTGSIVDNIVVDEKEWKALGERVWRNEEKNPGFLLKFMQGFEAQNKKDTQHWIKWKNEDYRDKSNNQLAVQYKQYVDKLNLYSPTIYIPLAVENQLFNAGLKVLKKMGKMELEKILFQPVKPGLVIEEEKSLLEIAIALKRGQSIENKIQRHIELFSWMKKNNYFMEFFDEKHYLNRAKAISNPEKQLEQLLKKISLHGKEFKKLLFHTSETDRITMETINHAIFFRSYRSEMICQSSLYVRELLREIAKRLEIGSELETCYLLPREVETALQGKANTEELSKIITDRKIAYTYIAARDGDLNAGGDGALECLRYFEKTQKIKPGSEAKGMATFKGTGTGKVKSKAVIVKSVAQLGKVKQGDIMIAHTTMPDYVPALKLVKGLVTEEGGILCHAALVSREMQIPCIVGAKHATQIFKDGDEVEIDTTSGIVRKV